MNGRGVALEVTVKLESGCEDNVHEFLKEEAECSKENDYSKADPGEVTEELICVKLEPEWEDPVGLCANHEVKDKLVLGPELLQQLCAAQGDGSEHKPIPELTSNTYQQTKAMDTYMCDICHKLFTKKHYLVRHIKVHMKKGETLPSKSSKRYFCAVCKKRFAQNGHFNRHKLTHMREKLYKCRMCKRAFTRKDSLKVHLRIHMTEKPFTCEFCDKGFTQMCNLTRHVRVHTGEKPYVCDICSKRCSQSQDLKTHKRIHEKEKPYSCNMCGERFKKASIMVAHKRSHFEY